MICSCGKRCDFIRATVVVDTLEKEYYCLSCSIYITLVKDARGNHSMLDNTGKIYREWNTNEN